jgi:hypothetical protein
MATNFLNKAWPTASILIADESNTDIPMEQAFQDSVNLFDLSGPLGTILISTGAAIALLIMLKSLTSQMDAAIEKVLVDFESTMRENYPERWNVISAQLDNVSPDERPSKLVFIMEQMQEEEPEFMNQVKEKMTDWKS